ncbi:hypothetical protein BGX28_004080 [Mortierella sp. GBA30]|nr:hypothetical protein BGX28_004080 [Mortierella sp. GBA30]
MATFKHFMGSKLIVLVMLVLLSLVTDVFAARLNYSARYQQGLGGKPGLTTLAQQITDEHEALILQHIGEWSGGKYTASKNRLNILMVSAVNMVQTKAQASSEVQDMRALIKPAQYRLSVSNSNED